MKCPNCGAIIAANTPSCPICGKQLYTAVQEPLHSRQRTYRPEQENPEYDHNAAASPDEYFLSDEYYGETAPYRSPARRGYGYGAELQRPVAARKSRVPYLITSFFASVLAVLQFITPFFEWAAFSYSLFGFGVSSGRLTLIELAWRVFVNKDIISMFTGMQDNYGIGELIPAEVREGYATARQYAILVAAVFAIGFLFYFIFIILALAQRRVGAAVTGILASLFNAAGCLSVIYFINTLNKLVTTYDGYLWNEVQFTALSMTYLSLGLSAAITVTCIIFLILGANTQRKKYN